MTEEEKEIISKKEKKKIEKLEEKIEELEAELEKAKADMEHWKNEYYRAYADTKNLRNNLEKEHREALKYRSEGFVEELLPVLDSFFSVLKNEPEDPNLKNYLIGFQYIYRNFVSALENEGVTEIAPEVGKAFDPKTMNAIDTVEGEDNIITNVYNNGYKLHERIIRPANVQVSIKPKEKNKEQDENLDA